MKLWEMLVSFSKSKSFYFKLYKSYWHLQFSQEQTKKNDSNYYSAIPNPGVGIGHQLANWISGYWFAKQFNLNFVHIPFSNDKWEQFLGFGEKESTINDLLKKGYKKIKLPLFDENNLKEFALQEKIIQSYSKQKIIFIAEQDQFYSAQYGVMDETKQKYYNANARREDKLRFSKTHFNIAIHVRRGDIITGRETQNSNLMMRWQDNNYFEKVLLQVLKNITTDKPIAIYLFSQGKKEDFIEFEQFSNLHYCLDWSAQDSFLHMVFADVLITSKSSFSYKPALLSNGVKICPKDFWHGYPLGRDWIMVDNQGQFDVNLLNPST